MTHKGTTKFLFEYTYGGAEWIGEVWADDFDDAQQKVRAMSRGVVSGTAVAKVQIPNWLQKSWRMLTGRHDA